MIMDLNNHHDEECSNKSSSEEEIDHRSEQANDDMGTGRSYECVFCKRGFTTAQALGGHMNIHRKDRAKSRPSSVPSLSSKLVDGDYGSCFGAYPPQHHYPAAHHEVHINYHTFLPAAATWGAGHLPYAHQRNGDHHHHLYVQSPPHHLNPFGEDWRRSLSLQIGPSHVDDDDYNNKEKIGDGSETGELDLELRLGHDP